MRLLGSLAGGKQGWGRVTFHRNEGVAGKGGGNVCVGGRRGDDAAYTFMASICTVFEEVCGVCLRCTSVRKGLCWARMTRGGWW